MSKLGKTSVNHGLVPVDLKTTKEPLPHQTVMKIFSISIIAQGLPFCRRRVSLPHSKSKSVYLMLVCLPVKQGPGRAKLAAICSREDSQQWLYYDLAVTLCAFLSHLFFSGG